jgi:hypothetical protein
MVNFTQKMIISHKYKFIFIKTAKTAGTSIEVFLSSLCGENDILTPIFPHVEPHRARNHDGFYNHMKASEVKAVVGYSIWDEYFKFCVERNPWDKTLSHFHMIAYRSENTLSLEEYFSNGRFCINFPKYTDKDAKIIVDKVVKYENLVTELKPIFKALGLPFDGDLGVRAKSEYRIDRQSYKYVLTGEQAAKIADVYSKELSMHGYIF